MQFNETAFEGLVEIIPPVFHDERGHFYETFQHEKFLNAGINTTFLQSNESHSKKGVIRGLHLQLPPYDQAKLVRAVQGEILDIVVDLRPSSKTYGKYFSCILSDKKKNSLFVPRGFAHGFAALTDCIFHYLCDNTYHPASEAGIRWNDDVLNIDWQISNPIISEKDQQLPTFKEFNLINTFS